MFLWLMTLLWEILREGSLGIIDLCNIKKNHIVNHINDMLIKTEGKIIGSKQYNPPIPSHSSVKNLA